jgi:cytoskeletal protein CcmA (bactofilin family)
MSVGVIAKGLYIKGEVRGEEDLVIEGTVEGRITMSRSLTIESGGRVLANLATENVIIRGEMVGDVEAREKVVIHQGGRLLGDVTAPRLELEDGAFFKGRVDMPDPTGVRSHAGAPAPAHALQRKR